MSFFSYLSVVIGVCSTEMQTLIWTIMDSPLNCILLYLVAILSRHMNFYIASAITVTGNTVSGQVGNIHV